MLRAAIVAGGILMSGAATGGTSAILADTATATPFDWSSLVGGALGSSPAALILGWRLSKADKELTVAREEIRELNERMAEKVVPIIERATSTLREVQQGMDATISRSRPEDVGRAIEGLRDAIEDMRRGRGQG